MLHGVFFTNGSKEAPTADFFVVSNSAITISCKKQDRETGGKKPVWPAVATAKRSCQDSSLDKCASNTCVSPGFLEYVGVDTQRNP